MIELGSVAVSAVFASVPVPFEIFLMLIVFLTFALPLTLIAPLAVLASFGRVQSVFETVFVSAAAEA